MHKIIAILVIINQLSCSQQQARKPISHSEGSFMKESAERNKKLNAIEEKTIVSLIKRTPEINFIASKKGYWYYYITKNETDSIYPTNGDMAIFDYDVKDFKGKIIYNQEDIQTQNYIIDKQNIMTGLQSGIKLMKKNEKVVFLFPSHMAYGYHGDNKKIGSNVGLICTVLLKDFYKIK